MERKSVSYEHERSSIKLTPKDTMILLFKDEFEYSCVVYTGDEEKDPTLIFDHGLMTFLAKKGFHIAESKQDIPEYIVNGYAKYQSNMAEEQWLGMVAVDAV